MYFIGMTQDSLSNPHNAFVRGMLERREAALDFFKQYLPADIAKQLDFTTLTILKESFVDKELSQHFSDILYRVKIDEKESYIYLLFEHKSYGDRRVAFQLLRYMVRIWDNYLKHNPRAKRLPVIVPFVLYHGKAKWSISTGFASLVEEVASTERYLPSFEYEIADISHIPDDRIKGGLLVRAFLLLLKHNRREKLFKALPEIFHLVRGLSAETRTTEYVEMFLRYVMATTEEEKKDQLKKQVRKSLEEGGRIMPTIAQSLIREGMEKGKAEGMEKGMEKGKLEAARNMISRGMPNVDIRDITGLSIRKIQQIRKEKAGGED